MLLLVKIISLNVMFRWHCYCSPKYKCTHYRPGLSPDLGLPLDQIAFPTRNSCSPLPQFYLQLWNSPLIITSAQQTANHNRKNRLIIEKIQVTSGVKFKTSDRASAGCQRAAQGAEVLQRLLRHLPAITARKPIECAVPSAGRILIYNGRNDCV